MLKRALRRLRAYAKPRASVLMYHRVAELESDVWELAVSPANFEQHLQVLQQTGLVLKANELVSRLAQHALPRRSIAITFDDGYGDNYQIARELLLNYKLPATFFITTGKTEQTSEFWWDELEAIFLLMEHLPPVLRFFIGTDVIEGELHSEQHLTPLLRQQHRQWKASSEAPPSQRAALYYKVWQRLKYLPFVAQQQALQQLRDWAGQPAAARSTYQAMTATQVQAMSQNSLFSVGNHTVTHPALSSLPLAEQRIELVNSQQVLHQLGSPAQLLAYPYGDYASETSALAAELGFQAAFTTDANSLTEQSALHQLGRFQVGNWTGAEFKQYLRRWLA